MYSFINLLTKNQAKLVPGRSGDRWRYDSYGNIVCKALKGCNGCLCHEYDHIIPHSKGGLSILDNCQILQTTINRRKGALLQDGEYIYMSHGCHKQYNDRELDIIELALYGDIANNSSSSKPKCTALRQFELVTKKSHCKEY